MGKMSIERVRKEMGLMEKIMSYIPGYRGYKEKEIRRETDILVRRKISGILAEARSMLNSPLGPSEARKLAYDQESRFALENIRTSLDKVAQRIDKAVAGYAGLFDAVKIREDKLDAVISHDLSLIEKAESIKAIVSDLFSKNIGTPEWKNTLTGLISAVRELDQLIDERIELLEGLSEVSG